MVKGGSSVERTGGGAKHTAVEARRGRGATSKLRCGIKVNCATFRALAGEESRRNVHRRARMSTEGSTMTMLTVYGSSLSASHVFIGLSHAGTTVPGPPKNILHHRSVPHQSLPSRGIA